MPGMGYNAYGYAPHPLYSAIATPNKIMQSCEDCCLPWPSRESRGPRRLGSSLFPSSLTRGSVEVKSCACSCKLVRWRELEVIVEGFERRCHRLLCNINLALFTRLLLLEADLVTKLINLL
jgi:hypothetical protein